MDDGWLPPEVARRSNEGDAAFHHRLDACRYVRMKARVVKREPFDEVKHQVELFAELMPEFRTPAASL